MRQNVFYLLRVLECNYERYELGNKEIFLKFEYIRVAMYELEVAQCKMY